MSSHCVNFLICYNIDFYPHYTPWTDDKFRAPHTYEYAENYKILAAINKLNHNPESINGRKLVFLDFISCSSNNSEWMSIEILKEWIDMNSRDIETLWVRQFNNFFSQSYTFDLIYESTAFMHSKKITDFYLYKTSIMIWHPFLRRWWIK